MNFDDLLQRARRGEQAAEDELYRLLMPVLRPLIARMLGQSAAKRVLDPTDLFHTALRRLLYIETCPENLQAWLLATARNRLLQIQKSHGVSRTHLDADGMVSLPESNSPLAQVIDGEEQVINEVTLAHIRQHLPPEVFESLVKHFDGISWADIAAEHASGTKPDTWRIHCRRALEKCKEEMAE
jgi:DNA-directed RNA polymerase specialized sigma24 family protein